MRLLLSTIACCTAGILAVPVAAQVSEQQLTFEVVATGLYFPLDVRSAPSDPDRLFITQQDGIIRVRDLNGLNPVPFLDIRPRVGAFGSSGLLGIAFHPDYANNGYFYLNYTDLAGDTVIARYQRGATPDLADPNSELILLQVAQPDSIHNGGGLAFGPDGYLYIALGDGGFQGDPFGYAQNLNELLGKILRIDVDQPSGGLQYSIPPTNPFIGQPGAREEIWAYGLRNPYRISIDLPTGDLYIGDVGERGWEEANFQPGSSPGGENYGWNITEGTDCYNPPTGCITAGITFAIHQYQHSVGSVEKCAVIGGLVYRGQRMATLQGRYFLGDQCANQVSSFLVQGGVATDKQMHFELPMIGSVPCSNVGWGQDAAGELYAVCHASGAIYRIAPKGMDLEVPELVAGMHDEISVSGATAGTNVFLVYSTVGLGSTPIGQLNVTLDLQAPVLGATRKAKSNGVVTFPVNVPSSYVGVRLWIQAAERDGKSNVYERVIQ